MTDYSSDNLGRCRKHNVTVALDESCELCDKERERAEQIALAKCESGECEDYECQRCCPHDELDHGICMDCGADRTDDLVAQAEYAFEGDR